MWHWEPLDGYLSKKPSLTPTFSSTTTKTTTSDSIMVDPNDDVDVDDDERVEEDDIDAQEPKLKMQKNDPVSNEKDDNDQTFKIISLTSSTATIELMPKEKQTSSSSSAAATTKTINLLNEIVPDEVLRDIIMGQVKFIYVIDPGLVSIFSVVVYSVDWDKKELREIEKFKITSKEMNVECQKSKNYQKLFELRKNKKFTVLHQNDQFPIGSQVSLMELESILPSTKCQFQGSLVEAVSIRSKYVNEIYNFYSQPQVMKLHFDSFIKKKQAMHRLISKKFGITNKDSAKNKMVLIGGGGVDGCKLRRPSTIGSSGQLVDVLRQRGLRTFYVDERYSSQTCHWCDTKGLKLLEYVSFDVQPNLIQKHDDDAKINIDDCLNYWSSVEAKKKERRKSKRKLNPISNRRKRPTSAADNKSTTISSSPRATKNTYEVLKEEVDGDMNCIDIDMDELEDVDLEDNTTTSKHQEKWRQQKDKKKKIQQKKKAWKQKRKLNPLPIPMTS